MDSINVGGKLLDLSKPVVMGILNVTSDSFYDGGEYNTVDAAITQVAKMLGEGMAILDIGACSTRPNSKPLAPTEELQMLRPILKEISTQFPDLVLSIDSYHAEVISTLAEGYAFIANDVNSAHQSDSYLDCVSANGFPYVLMHLKGELHNMPTNPHYEDVTYEMLNFFTDKAYRLREKGINQILLDPGFGFGKSVEHNYEILKKMNVFNIQELPILAGLSRKSMVYKLLKTTPSEALNGTTALNMVALMNGAKILRVHDVKEAVETISLWQKLS